MARKRIADPTDDSAMQDPVADEVPDSELPDTRTDMEKMADRIAEGVARGINAAAPRRKISFAEYDPKSPWQKGTPKKKMPKLDKECFQNGMRMVDDKMTAEEINLVNQLKPGRYIDRLVEVVIQDDGPDSAKILHLRYSDTRDHMLNLRGRIRVAKSRSGLANMCYHIIDEQNGVVFEEV